MRRWDAWFLCLLVFLSLLLRAWPVLSIDHIWEDAYYYLELARSISHGHYNLLGRFHTKYLPGFPVAVLVGRIITFGSLDWFITGQCVLTVCSASLPVLCYYLAYQISDDRAASRAAAILASLSPFLVAYSGIPFSECYFAFLLAASLLLIGRDPLLAGLLGGLCAVTRHEGWFLLPALLFYHVEFTRHKPYLRFDLSRLRRLAGGVVVFAVIGGFWWALSYLMSGELLSSTYTSEAAKKSIATGHAGLRFLAFSFPVAGHAASLFAIVGLAPAALSRTGRSILVFLVLYLGLHMWWVSVLERYFVVLAPLVCVLAGLGISETAKLAFEYWRSCREDARKRGRLLGAAVPVVALLAGAFHFFGYGPAFIREQSSRSEGYVEAAEYVDRVSRGNAVLAYDYFLLQFHAPQTDVYPSGTLQSSQWETHLPRLYVHEDLRYILWSELYPLDKKKDELGGGSFMVRGEVDTQGVKQNVVLWVMKEKQFRWKCYYPGPDRTALFRDTEWKELRAIVYKLKRIEGKGSPKAQRFD